MKLKGKRGEQLAMLHSAGAFSRETAVCVSFDHTWSPGTLSAMVGEALTLQAQLPYNGDSKRRTSHYWLTPIGRQVAAIERAIRRCQGEGWTVRGNAATGFKVVQIPERHIFTPNQLLDFAGIAP